MGNSYTEQNWNQPGFREAFLPEMIRAVWYIASHRVSYITVAVAAGFVLSVSPTDL